MDEQEMINDRIKDFFLKKGINSDTISKGKMEKLEKVDQAIQRRLKIIEKSKNDINENKINISNISNETGISRKTFYNNDLLKSYVEFYSNDDDNEEKNVTTTKQYKNLKEKLDQANKHIELFIMRDIDIENLKHENQELLKENENKQKQIRYLEEENEKIRNELWQLKSNLSKIIPFESKESKNNK